MSIYVSIRLYMSIYVYICLYMSIYMSIYVYICLYTWCVGVRYDGVIRCESTRRGKKVPHPSRDQKMKARTVVGKGGGGKSLIISDLGSELRLRGREKKKGIA